MSKILVLCHGNYMRSPAAEAVLRAEGLNVVSAGFMPRANHAAKRMRDAMAARGYDLSKHNPQKISEELMRGSSHILYMDNGNLTRLTGFTAGVHAVTVRASCLGTYHEPPLRKIQDPAFLSRTGPDCEKFDAIVDQIIAACKGFAKYWKGISE